MLNNLQCFIFEETTHGRQSFKAFWIFEVKALTYIVQDLNIQNWLVMSSKFR